MARSIVPVFLTLLFAGLPVVAEDIADDQISLLRPGLTKSVVHEVGSTGAVLGGSFWEEGSQLRVGSGHGGGSDAAGGFYHVALKRVSSGTEAFCESASGSRETDVYEIERLANGGAELVARIPACLRPIVFCPSLCGSAGLLVPVTHAVDVLNLAVDGVGGHLYLAIQASNTIDSGITSDCVPCTGYSGAQNAIVRISGLPSVLEVIPTFEPSAGTLSWVVPRHPEALPAAERFSVYAGDLRDLPDFSRAAPVACAVPDSGAPQPGDFLSILDPLPDPEAGRGSYALIGAEYAGQRRFGRQNIGGLLSGRDPAAFRACN